MPALHSAHTVRGDHSKLLAEYYKRLDGDNMSHPCRYVQWRPSNDRITVQKMGSHKQKYSSRWAWGHKEIHLSLPQPYLSVVVLWIYVILCLLPTGSFWTSPEAAVTLRFQSKISDTARTLPSAVFGRKGTKSESKFTLGDTYAWHKH